MKIMAVDYGDSRTGLAMCDKGEVLASPLYTINMKDFDRCLEMTAEAAVSYTHLTLPTSDLV